MARGGARAGAGRKPFDPNAVPDTEAERQKRLQSTVQRKAFERAVSLETAKIIPIAVRARSYSDKCLDAYVACLDDKKAQHGDKIRAATEILNRAWGRAVENVNINTTNAFSGLTDDELRRAIAALDRAAENSERFEAATDITADTEITDELGRTSGLQTSAPSPLPAAETAEGGGEPQ